ncbi:protein kinase [Polaribacter litorisediminis]|uniref:protein kinase n=1 Tax=Polaribacter litorisediminis TaxID=1908341 RepID=UPI001CBBB966|nr:protein kinase [Polaribacter litorisediminis]UAM97325.1 protein kinase [Polaribacter litorisediminis]
MKNTLQELRSGSLMGSKRLKLACGLKQFPEEILSLAKTLEILDLSNNHLSELPESISQLQRLKIIFFENNNFEEFPKVLQKCPELTMIGFKSNQIHTVPENAFPSKLRWLILTNNRIQKIPKSIGTCFWLQKCALAGNQIEALPSEMANCVNLELLRISANKLQSIPEWLFQLPKLSWVAFAGNPASYQVPKNNDFESFHWNNFILKEQLGEGASGMISRAHWTLKKEDVAVKVFKGAVTSDGLPEDEMEVSISAGSHQNLIEVLGKIKSHPEQKSGLIMKLISPSFVNLGNPPNLETCTRDVFDEKTVFTAKESLKVAKSIASAAAQLHSRGINHGDLYAHNILVNAQGECLLGDFGAAMFYDINSTLAHLIQRVEIRAFGCLLEDLWNLIDKNKLEENLLTKWQQLIIDCTIPEVSLRPSFSEVLGKLNHF